MPKDSDVISVCRDAIRRVDGLAVRIDELEKTLDLLLDKLNFEVRGVSDNRQVVERGKLLGSACTIGQLGLALESIGSDCPVRFDGKGPVEIYLEGEFVVLR